MRPQSQYSLMKGQCLLDSQTHKLSIIYTTSLSKCEPSLSPAAPLLVGVPAEVCVAHRRICKTYHTTEWKPAGHLMNDGLYGVRCVCASCGYHQWFCATQCVQGSGWCKHGKRWYCTDCELEWNPATPTNVSGVFHRSKADAQTMSMAEFDCASCGSHWNHPRDLRMDGDWVSKGFHIGSETFCANCYEAYTSSKNMASDGTASEATSSGSQLMKKDSSCVQSVQNQNSGLGAELTWAPNTMLLLCDGITQESEENVKALVRSEVGTHRFTTLANCGSGMIVLLCVDGFRNSKQTKHIDSTKAWLSTFFQTSISNVSVFSFATASTIPLCHVFCMMGGNAYALMQKIHANSQCMTELQRRIKEGEVFYISTSGGTVVAGDDLRYCPDDLVQGVASDVGGLGLVPARIVIPMSHAKQFTQEQCQSTAGDAKRLCMPKGSCLATAQEARTFNICKGNTCALQMFEADSHRIFSQEDVHIGAPDLAASLLDSIKGTADVEIVFEKPDGPPDVVLFWLTGTGDASQSWYRLMGTKAGAALRSRSVLVVCPRHTGASARKPWATSLPPCVEALFHQIEQVTAHFKVPLWLAGFSRGASWGASLLLKQTRMLSVQRAILMMPYVLPLNVDDKERASYGEGLILCATEVYIAFSTNDAWWAQSEVLMNAFRKLDTSGTHSIDLTPLEHDGILAHFKDSLATEWLLK